MNEYKIIPAILSAQPSNTKSTAIFIKPAAHLTKRATPMKTTKKASTGSHLPSKCISVLKWFATTADSLIAAANPTTNARTEKTATIKPCCKPLKMANNHHGILRGLAPGVYPIIRMLIPPLMGIPLLAAK